MAIPARRLRGLRDLVQESDTWELPENLWDEVRRIVELLGRLLAERDLTGIADAEHELRNLDPGRRTYPAQLESTAAMPEPVRERKNVLVHRIEVLLADEPVDRR